ncbi:MAG: DUF4058 family protein [Spirulinaceae cyanobacterium]
MPYPFPGMNPYLEHPQLWSEVHNRLIVNLADILGPQLRPKYRVAVEKRTYIDRAESALIGLPDVTISSKKVTEKEPSSTTLLQETKAITVRTPMPEEFRESYLEIREISTEAVVTAIEILSPKNKRPGVGRATYERKRLEVLGSLTHLIEIDLLRRGKPMEILEQRSPGDYSILISRSNKRPFAELYLFGVREEIPSFPLPLRSEDQEPLVNLQTVLEQVYERASFDLTLNYTIEAIPPLKGEDQVWADGLLREKLLR